MAVRHGYGKIAGADALVFAYDTGDTRNSYRGEPTTNLLPAGVASGHNSGGYGNVVTVTDATVEKGPGWKKVTISNRGSNYRIIQWSYLSMLANNTYCFSAEFDWGNMRGKGYYLNHDGTGTGVRAFYLPGNYTSSIGTTVNILASAPDGKVAGTITHTADHTHSFFINNTTTGSSGLNDYFYYKDFQVEINTHPTQYTTGTRSSTQGLLDLTGNSTIDLANVSFDANAQMTFDGTNDLMSIAANGTTNYSQPFTIECVFKVDSGATWDNGYRSNIFGIAGSYSGMYGLFKNNNNNVGLQLRDATSTAYATAAGLSKGVYYHLTGTWNGSDTMVLYVNGVATQTTSTTKTGATGSPNLYVGGLRAYGGAAGNYYQGEIPVAKYYNRALTAAEVRNNYNQYKGRFNL